MGKKKPSSRQWTVHLESVYRRNRDERIARAYELALPVITATTRNIKEEEKDHDTAATSHRHLRARLQ
jgi:hypothetical protein